jgi:hypothetical protein
MDVNAGEMVYCISGNDSEKLKVLHFLITVERVLECNLMDTSYTPK